MAVNYHRSRDGAEAAANEIRDLERRAIVVQADVSKRNDVDRMIRQTLSAFGKINILVNDAGLLVAAPIENLREED